MAAEGNPAVPMVLRPRARTTEDKEVRLGSHAFDRSGVGEADARFEHEEIRQAVREFIEACGLEKNAVSEHFVEASRASLPELLEWQLDKLRFCALSIDATRFEGHQMIVALGIGQDGRKAILGLRQAATENATVVGALLDDLVNRGFDFSAPRLYVLDGGKALQAAVKKYAADAAPTQRWQIQKRAQCARSFARAKQALKGCNTS